MLFKKMTSPTLIIIIIIIINLKKNKGPILGLETKKKNNVG